MCYKLSSAILAAAMVLGGAGKLGADTIIDATAGWNGTSSVGPFNGGAGHGRAFGQTFVVGGDSVLDSFTFYVEGQGTMFSGFVMEWSVDRVSGPILFQSTPQAASPGLSSPDTFTTDGLELVAGHTYVAFVDAGDSYQSNDGFRVGICSGQNPYTGGNLVASAYADPNTFEQLSTVPWEGRLGEGSSDAAFIARFSSVPEPSTLILLCAGATSLLAYVWRRRWRAA